MDTASLASRPPAMDMGLVRAAMAFRVKYRVCQDRKLISLSRLGVRKLNRGGVYPQPDTVRNLGLKLLGTGFNESEANHEGVCLEEVPFNERGKEPYESCLQYNMQKCIHPFLSKCFTPQSDVMYGTLSHSHLLLVMLTLANGGHWKLPEEWNKLLTPDGSFSPAAVAACDLELGKLLKDGLRMDVLSWKMRIEEPTAGSLISQALNNVQHMALRTSELTAMAVLTGAVGLALESAVAGEVAFESVQEKVRDELDMCVDTPGFMDLFEFVVNMGASKNTFIPQLLEYGSKFVDPKQRQLSLQAFAEVNKLPLQVPRVKVAMVMRAYRKPPNKCWCPAPEPTWANRDIRSLEKLEAVLHYLQRTCKPAVAGMPPLQVAALSANFHCAAAEAFILRKEPRQEKDAILDAVSKYYEEITGFAASHGLEVPKPGESWIDFVATRRRRESKAAVAKPETQRLLPKLIEYDEDTGLPMNAQDIKVATPKHQNIAIVPWREWLGGRVAKELDQEATHMVAITMVLHSLHTRGNIEAALVDVSIDLDKSRKVVTASEDLPPGTLSLPPCAPKMAKAYTASVHPHRVAIVVTDKSAVADKESVRKNADVAEPAPVAPALKQKTYYAHPEYKFPEESKEDLPDGVSPDVRVWKWKGDEVTHPFWAVPRLSVDELRKMNAANPQKQVAFNVKLQEKEFSVVTVGAADGGSVSVALTVAIPVITNSTTVKKGEELALPIAARTTAKRKAQSWKDVVADTSSAKAKAKCKAQIKGKSQAAPMEIDAEI